MAGAAAGASSGASAGAGAGVWGAGIGAVVGAVGGAIQEAQSRAEASRMRRRTRKGIAAGEARTQKEVYDILNSQEYRLAQGFTLGTFGASAGSGQASYDAPISFAGRDFFAAPTGEAFSKGDKQTGSRLAHQFDDILAARAQLESGVGKNGKPLTERQMDRLSAQADSGRIDNLMGAVGSLDANEANSFARQLGKAGIEMADFQDLRAESLGRNGNPQMSAQTLEGGGGMNNPLAQNFRTQIGVAQNARGIYSSQAAAGAEASGMAAFQYEQQQQMLPMLMQQAKFGSDAYHSYEGANIGREVQRATGGVGVYGAANPFTAAPGGAVQGAIAGGFAGGSLGVNIASLGVQQDYNNQRLAQQNQNSSYNPGGASAMNPFGTQFGSMFGWTSGRNGRGY